MDVTQQINCAELQQAIEFAARRAFTELRESKVGNEICAFALYSDAGAMTVCSSVNTVEHLQRMQSRDPDDALYYKYSPAEWRFESIGTQIEFARISAGLRSAIEQVDGQREPFERLRSCLFETCIRALEALRSEGFFPESLGSEFLLMFVVSDMEESAEVEIARVARLNSARVAAEFTEWARGWSKC